MRYGQKTSAYHIIQIAYIPTALIFCFLLRIILQHKNAENEIDTGPQCAHSDGNREIYQSEVTNSS